jgi:transcription-repair coupling factor (superfamily II helicase)
LVVDEEQRFGVKDKERIKEMRLSIDCLSLSATPIPRTLYMSLLKIRDMSLLTTPPIERLPIKTFIQQYDEGLVVKAIKEEVARAGQVFYLHNRIETLDEVVRFLRADLPGVIIESAHGQMDSDELEDTMRRFLSGGIQVLVSTTIIENGIDIPTSTRSSSTGLTAMGSASCTSSGAGGPRRPAGVRLLVLPNDETLSDVALKRLR